MASIRVTHTIDDLESDLRRIPVTAARGMATTVRRNAEQGNRRAKEFASEQHTMFGDEDINYPPSFTAEARGPLTWEYGADSAIGDGSKSPGYEHGSINSPPHYDHARSADIQGPQFQAEVRDLLDDLFWPS